MNAIFTFFKKVKDWFKALPSFWKKFISYVFIFLIGIVLGLVLTGYILGRQNINLERRAEDLNRQLIEVTTLANTIQKNLTSANGKLADARTTITGLEESDNRKSILIDKLRANNTGLTEINRKLTEDNRRFREGNVTLQRINSEIEGRLKDYRRLIEEGSTGLGTAEGSLEEILGTLQSIQERSGITNK
jgi:chromosome segregation ATPase